MSHWIINKLFVFAIGLLALSCNGNHVFDASGSFEAEETIISSQAQGVILRLDLDEGQELARGVVVGYVDSVQLYLKKEQLLAQIEALSSRKPDVKVQLASLQEQLNTSQRERDRTSNLVKGDAATTKQLDDIDAQITLLKRQIDAQRSSLNTSTTSIDKESRALQIQVEQLDDQLTRCKIVNPVNGTVLTRYARVNETTAIGKPLYRIADLSEMILRIYISGDQLSQIRLNQQVKVHTDDGHGGFRTTEGRVAWISDKAEFTPKTIQTKDERANLVYAIKIKVENDGTYKIGMYGEVSFN